jgi:hypothetical protein
MVSCTKRRRLARTGEFLCGSGDWGGLWIYADGIAAHSAGAARTINANLGLKISTHTLLMRAWDTSGAYGDQTLTVTVSTNPRLSATGRRLVPA